MNRENGRARTGAHSHGPRRNVPCAPARAASCRPGNCTEGSRPRLRCLALAVHQTSRINSTPSSIFNVTTTDVATQATTEASRAHVRRMRIVSPRLTFMPSKPRLSGRNSFNFGTSQPRCFIMGATCSDKHHAGVNILAAASRQRRRAPVTRRGTREKPLSPSRVPPLLVVEEYSTPRRVASVTSSPRTPARPTTLLRGRRRRRTSRLRKNAKMPGNC